MASEYQKMWWEMREIAAGAGIQEFALDDVDGKPCITWCIWSPHAKEGVHAKDSDSYGEGLLALFDVLDCPMDDPDIVKAFEKFQGALRLEDIESSELDQETLVEIASKLFPPPAPDPSLSLGEIESEPCICYTWPLAEAAKWITIDRIGENTWMSADGQDLALDSANPDLDPEGVQAMYQVMTGN